MKLKTYVWLILQCSSAILVYGKTLNLKFVHAKTQEVIPYVAVFSQDNKEGSYADAEGVFNFNFSEQVDTVLMSAIGFGLKKQAIQDIGNEKIIRLDPIVVELPDVTVLSKKATIVEKKLGYFKRFRSIPTFSVITSLSNRFALLIPNAEGKEGWISHLRIRFDVNESKIASSYRILPRIYRNNQGKPGEDILGVVDPIDVRTAQQSLEIEIASKKIVFPLDGAFIGYDVLGYTDKNEGFHLFRRGQKVDTKPKEWPDHLCPNLAMWKKASQVVLFEAHGLNAWKKSPLIQFGAPMFGIIVGFRE